MPIMALFVSTPQYFFQGGLPCVCRELLSSCLIVSSTSVLFKKTQDIIYIEHEYSRLETTCSKHKMSFVLSRSLPRVSLGV